jgi:hypothetical protein
LARRIVTEEYPILLGFALTGAHEISEMGRFEVPTCYKPSSWIHECQEKVFVYPPLADSEYRPRGYRGVRLAEGHFGALIGH